MGAKRGFALYAANTWSTACHDTAYCLVILSIYGHLSVPVSRTRTPVMYYMQSVVCRSQLEQHHKRAEIHIFDASSKYIKQSNSDLTIIP